MRLADLPPLVLRQVYEMLACLEGTSMKAQQALESGTNVRLKEAHNLNSYFQKVRGGGSGEGQHVAGRALKKRGRRFEQRFFE